MGIRGPSLYEYFPSRHAFHDALLARGLAEELAAIGRAVDGDPRGARRTTLDRDEVSTVVAASPEEVYALVADLARMPEFSPEVASTGWLDGASGPAVGARFEAVNTDAAGKSWRNRPVVTVAEPGREFAFVRTEPLAGTIRLALPLRARGRRHAGDREL